jgi:hypothetical protein
MRKIATAVVISVIFLVALYVCQYELQIFHVDVKFVIPNNYIGVLEIIENKDSRMEYKNGFYIIDLRNKRTTIKDISIFNSWHSEKWFYEDGTQLADSTNDLSIAGRFFQSNKDHIVKYYVGTRKDVDAAIERSRKGM